MDLVMLNLEQLSAMLTERDWKRDVESIYSFNELYEQVDESEKWYMKPEWQDIYDAMQDEWKIRLIELEEPIINSITSSL